MKLFSILIFALLSSSALADKPNVIIIMTDDREYYADSSAYLYRFRIDSGAAHIFVPRQNSDPIRHLGLRFYETDG